MVTRIEEAVYRIGVRRIVSTTTQSKASVIVDSRAGRRRPAPSGATSRSAQARLPTGVSMAIWQNEAAVLADRLSLMLRNGMSGLLLVFLVLALISCSCTSAFWVAAGIPVAFLGAVTPAPLTRRVGFANSLFGFILVLGIVDDDAVIVGENVRRHQERHGEGLRGAVCGAQMSADPSSSPSLRRWRRSCRWRSCRDRSAGRWA